MKGFAIAALGMTPLDKDFIELLGKKITYPTYKT
jgi:hypothetical protein